MSHYRQYYVDYSPIHKFGKCSMPNQPMSNYLNSTQQDSTNPFHLRIFTQNSQWIEISLFSPEFWWSDRYKIFMCFDICTDLTTENIIAAKFIHTSWITWNYISAMESLFEISLCVLAKENENTHRHGWLAIWVWMQLHQIDNLWDLFCTRCILSPRVSLVCWNIF